MRKKKLPYVKALSGLFCLCLSYYFAWPFVSGKERMQSFCKGISPGQSLTDLSHAARSMSYRVTQGTVNQAIVHEPRTFGRHVCYIVVNQEKVVTTKYGFND